MLRHFTIQILLSIFLLVSVESIFAGTVISNLHFDIHTKGDDKDSQEPLNIQILKEYGEILYDSGWIGDDQLFPKNSHYEWKAPGPGHPIRFPILLEDCSKLKFLVEKAGDKTWEVSFRVRGNNGQLVLVTDTPIVIFGKKNLFDKENPIRVEEPLESSGGTMAHHFNGRNVHLFEFTCSSER